MMSQQETLTFTSGVTSRALKPVPPVVRIRFTSSWIHHCSSLFYKTYKM